MAAGSLGEDPAMDGGVMKSNSMYVSMVVDCSIGCILMRYKV